MVDQVRWKTDKDIAKMLVKRYSDQEQNYFGLVAAISEVRIEQELIDTARW